MSERFDALVLDAHTRPSLAVTRSLARAGYRVALGSSTASAPALASRYVRDRVDLPDPNADIDAYAAAIARVVAARSFDAVLSSTDESVAALRLQRQAIEPHTSPALAEPEALAIAISKERTLAVAASLRIPCPRSLRVEQPEEVAAAASEVGYPCVLKPEESWRRVGEHGGERVTAAFLRDASDAAREAGRLLRSGAAASVQEFAPGLREAIQLFRHDGRITARFAAAASRTWPPLGGADVMRVSVPPDSPAVASAEQLLHAIGYEGFAQVEFRRRADGLPLLMEINPRFPGSLELALRCGVDFPRMQLEWARGGSPRDGGSYRRGVRLSWPRGELLLLQAAVRGGLEPRPELGRTLRAIARDYLPRPPHLDNFSLRDPAPALTTVGAGLRAVTSAGVAALRRREGP